MKKKLILILSMVALLVCVFAISASATDVWEPIFYCTGDFSSFSDWGSSLASGFSYLDIRNINGFEDTFPFYYETSVIALDIDDFRNYCSKYDISSYSDLCTKLISYEQSELDVYSYVNCITNDFNSVGDQIFDFYYNYSVYSEADLTNQYNQGKKAGVTEYKESEEYTNILSSKYEEGKTAGVTEYEAETLPGLITAAKAEAVEDYETNTLPGLISEAVSDHKMSDEHKAELDAQLATGEELGKQSGYLLGHSDGYNEGYADGEAENKNGAPIAIVACLAILLPLVFAALIISSKKKKKII